MPIAPLTMIGLIPTISDIAMVVGIGGGTIGWAAGCDIAGTCDYDALGITKVPVARVEKRQDVGPCNVPMYNFNMCKDQVSKLKVTGSSPSPDVAQFDNVPPACMDLIVVLGGSCNGDGNRPEMCGSACVKYTGLSDTQLASLKQTLGV